MIPMRNEGIILEKTALEFENQAVLNPACIEKDGIIHLYYRAVGEGNVSSIGYCKLKDPTKVFERMTVPLLFPEYDYEKQGVEDPRIVEIDGVYFLTYTAYDGRNARIVYAVSHDLAHFEKQGLISPDMSYDEAEDYFRELPISERYLMFESYYKDKLGKNVLLWEKDASLFPEKINNKFALLHRILPGIQIIYFDDFKNLTKKYWIEYLKNLNKFILLDPEFLFENRNIGGGCPPIKTKEGWLLIYHAVEDIPGGKTYHAAAALLDLKNLQKVLGRLRDPLFSPEEPWEKMGAVKNVVFPTGAIVREGRLYIYYGAADTLIAAKSIELEELIYELKKSK